jgi:formylglycine-generating enzyme required for sulfatase activity
MAKVTEQRYQQTIHYFAEPLPGILKPLNMVFIPGGTFLMGSPEDEEGRSNNESPQHLVKVPSFFMSEFLITQAHWAVVAQMPQIKKALEINPSYFQGHNHPVETISWFDAEEFCERLSLQTRRKYRLPTEAEWEYACRAGTETPFHFSEAITTDLANYNGMDDTESGRSVSFGQRPKVIYRAKTTPVDEFYPNAFGLYDMHGNVWEWCSNHWHSDYGRVPITDVIAWSGEDVGSPRIMRGGSWYDNPRYCRSAFRTYNNPATRSYNIDFRIVCDMPEIVFK